MLLKAGADKDAKIGVSPRVKNTESNQLSLFTPGLEFFYFSFINCESAFSGHALSSRQWSRLDRSILSFTQ